MERKPDSEQTSERDDHRADTAPLQHTQDTPMKRHGDALQTGTGTRHGADAEQEARTER